VCDRCLWALDAFERYRGLAPGSGDHCANCLLGVGELLDAVDRPAVCEQAVATAMGGLHLKSPKVRFRRRSWVVLAHADPVCVVPGTDLGAVISGGFAVDVPGTRRPSPPSFLPVCPASALHILLGGLSARGGEELLKPCARAGRGAAAGPRE
jgi:hypothetical protein